eukprot:10699237-Karenia_brevis.AAC.1
MLTPRGQLGDAGILNDRALHSCCDFVSLGSDRFCRCTSKAHDGNCSEAFPSFTRYLPLIVKGKVARWIDPCKATVHS